MLLAKNEDVAVAQAGNATLLEVTTLGADRMLLTAACVGQALDAFIVQGRPHPEGAYVTLVSAGTDYTNDVAPVINASGDLTTLAAGSTGWVLLDVRGLESVKVLASSGNVAGSTVSVFANAH